MSLKEIATIALVGVAVAAAWLAAAASTSVNRVVPVPPAERASTLDTSREALANEIARLHDRLRPSATPRQPGRNLFQFTATRPAAIPAAKPVLSEPELQPVRPPAS